jgi:hypothetical protein
MVAADRALAPAKPVVMAEGAYEAGSEYGFEVTPLWVRRQAYYSYLAGGHHAYGHNDSWRLLPTWRAALDAPGAAQMGVLRRVMEARPGWWAAVPDQAVFAGEPGEGPLRNVAIRSAHVPGSARRGWVLIYLGQSTTVTLEMDRIAPGATQVEATWIDPVTGGHTLMGDCDASGACAFTPPAGWEDALLLLQTET